MDKSTFHVGGSSSQVIISSYHQQETLPLPIVNMTAYLPFVSSSAATNILAFANFPLDSSQRTLPLLENLPSFVWKDPSQIYLNFFNQLLPQYISSNNVRHIESCDPMDIKLNNICQVYSAPLFLVFQYDWLLVSLYSNYRLFHYNVACHLSIQKENQKFKAAKEYSN